MDANANNKEKKGKKSRKRGHGEGSIYQRQDGRWVAQITTGHDAEGKPILKYIYGRTRTEVKEKMQEIQADIVKGTFVQPAKITLGEWINRWLEVYKKPNIRPGSYSNYEQVTKTHIIPAIGDIQLQSLKTDTLQEVYNKKRTSGRLDGKGGLSPRIIHLMHQVINGALKQAVRNKIIIYNPAEAVTLPKLKYQEMKLLNKEQVKEYLNAAKGHRLFAAFLLELSTGLRRGELLGLKWEDLDLQNRTLTVRRALARVKIPDKGTSELIFQEPKTEKGRRTIPLLPAIVMELNAHKVRQDAEKELCKKAYQDTGLVFCTPIGTPIEPRNFHRLHTSILEKAQLPHVRFHDLRHTFATIMVEAGEEPKVLQELLGHARISTTYDIYVKTSMEMKSKALKSLEGIILEADTGTEGKKEKKVITIQRKK